MSFGWSVPACHALELPAGHGNPKVAPAAAAVCSMALKPAKLTPPTSQPDPDHDRGRTPRRSPHVVPFVLPGSRPPGLFSGGVPHLWRPTPKWREIPRCRAFGGADRSDYEPGRPANANAIKYRGPHRSGVNQIVSSPPVYYPAVGGFRNAASAKSMRLFPLRSSAIAIPSRHDGGPAHPRKPALREGRFGLGARGGA